MLKRSTALQWYEQNARTAAQGYESLAFKRVHEWVLDLLPHNQSSDRDNQALRRTRLRVLDIGAGSGRDALWFAQHGYQVTAVEPCEALRLEARKLHSHNPDFRNIQWINDQLPDLRSVQGEGLYDVIWLSAVWMHLEPSSHAVAFERLVQLMKPEALMMFSLRHPADPARGMYEVTLDSIERLAKQNTVLMARYQSDVPDERRAEVRWDHVALKRPNEVAKGLATLRRIIEYDKKTTTYKLGLLRTLCRVADSFPHFVDDDGDTTQVPLGLVALIWCRLYSPLMKFNIPQIGAGRRLKLEDPKIQDVLHRNITKLSQFIDLRPGGMVNPQYFSKLSQAFNEAIKVVAAGPVKYIADDNNKNPLFSLSKLRKKNRWQAQAVCSANRVSFNKAEQTSFDYCHKKFKINNSTQIGLISDEYFKSFGVLNVPSYIWRAFCRYSTWIEPTIVSAWQSQSIKFAEYKKQNLDLYQLHHAMVWQDASAHDTHYVRANIMDPMLEDDTDVYCVWSGKKLNIETRATDHCLPFSLWPCNDLWNLMPADKKINLDKTSKLPSREALNQSEERIQNWWHRAYTQDRILKAKFLVEARMRLPLYAYAHDYPDEIDLQDIFNGLRQQQLHIKNNSHPPEWSLDRG